MRENDESREGFGGGSRNSPDRPTVVRTFRVLAARRDLRPRILRHESNRAKLYEASHTSQGKLSFFHCWANACFGYRYVCLVPEAASDAVVQARVEDLSTSVLSSRDMNPGEIRHTLI